MNKWKVKVSDTRTERGAYIREGTEIYRHPKGYFVTLEFQGKVGKFRESFQLNELQTA